MVKFKNIKINEPYEIPKIGGPIAKPFVIKKADSPVFLSEVSRGNPELSLNRMQITPDLSNNSISSPPALSVFLPPLALMEGNSGGSGLLTLAGLVFLGMAHAGKGGVWAWLRSLRPWRKETPVPKQLPPDPRQGLFRDRAASSVDLTMAEKTQQNIRQALKDGAAKPTPALMAMAHGGDGKSDKKMFGWLKELFPLRKDQVASPTSPPTKETPEIEGAPYRGLSDPTMDLAASDSLFMAQEAWDRVERFLRVWSWGKFITKTELIDYLVSPEGRKDFEETLGLARFYFSGWTPYSLLMPGAEGYQLACLSLIQHLLRTTQTVEELRQRLAIYRKQLPGFNSYLLDVSHQALERLTALTGVKASYPLHYALKDILHGLLFDRFEAWIVDQGLYAGKNIQVFLKELKGGEKLFRIQLDEEGDLQVTFEKAGMDREQESVSTRAAFKEVLRILLGHPDPRVREEASRLYYNDFSGF